jgi:hypothetical protein
MGKFQKGASGNPAGRPPGTAKIEPLRAAIREHVPVIINALVAQAKAGDAAAARLLLERAIPALKAAEAPVQVDLAGETLTARASLILDQVAAGSLSTADAKALLDALAAVAKLREVDELVRRIEVLEARR